MTQHDYMAFIHDLKAAWMDELRDFVAGMGTDDTDAVVSAAYICHLAGFMDFPDGEFKPFAMARMRNSELFGRLLVLEEWQHNNSKFLNPPDTAAPAYLAGSLFAHLDPYQICLTALCFAYAGSELREDDKAAATATWDDISRRAEGQRRKPPLVKEIIRRGIARGLVQAPSQQVVAA